jgi:uncharacterized protein YlxW (UPF0749 family)
VLAAAGLLFVTSAENADGTDLRGGRYGDLPELVRAAADRSERLADQVAGLRGEVDRLSRGQGSEPAGGAGSTDDLARTAAVGLAAVTGPALRVTLDDAEVPTELPEDTSVDDYLVHQQDVEGVLNALWSGGAEAVAVMGHRITTTSAVRCVGPVLLLDGRTYYPPYEITAIGDVTGMRASLDASPEVSNYRQWADALGLDYAVADVARVGLPAYDGPLVLRHSTPRPTLGR